MKKTLLAGVALVTSFAHAPQARAALNTYHWQISSGTTVAGATTNWPNLTCGSQPTATVQVTTLMTAAAFSCAADRLYNTTAAVTSIVLLVKDTTYTQATTVTGQATGTLFTLRNGSSTAGTMRFYLGYVSGGAFTSFGFVDQAFTGSTTSYTINLSTVTGIAPVGSALALRAELRSKTNTGDVIRIYFGSSNTNSGTVVVDETVSAVNSTGAGTVTAVSTTGSCTGITVTAPYTNDSNVNNTLSYRYRTPTGTGTWVGPTTRTHSASPYSFGITGLAFGATYDVEVTYVDADGVTGTAIQTVSNITVGASCTGAGTATAAQTTGTTPSIAVSAPYVNDANANNTLSYRYRTPTGTGTYGAAVPLAHAASPYAATISGLTCGSSYDVEVTYVDADAIGSGTAVQTISNIVLTNCTTVGTPTGIANSCSQVTVSAPYTNNANASGSTAFARGTAAGGPFTAVAACTTVTGASPRQCVDTTVAASTTYYYQVTVTDADGVTGTNPAVTAGIATPVCNEPIVTTGTPTATVNSCTQITVTAPYTGDTNTNSTTKVEWNTANTWPGTTPAACSAITGASPRSCVVSGLANNTAYYFRVTFTDADGVTGTNPQVIGPFSTQDCRVVPGVPTGVANSCAQVTVSAPFTEGGSLNSTTTFNRGTAAGGPFSTVVCSNVAGASPRQCVDSTVAASTTYYYQVVFTDPDGVNGLATQVTAGVAVPACTVNNTTIGAVSALNSNCGTAAAATTPGAIVATATFTGDGNLSGSTSFEYNTTNTWPGTAACTKSGPSPRQCTITGLVSGSTYWVRATFTDADGVTGTNPTAGVSTGAVLPVCAADTVAPTITLLVPSRNAILSGADVVKVQVFDVGGLAATNPVQFSIDGAAYSATGVTTNANYACGTSCAVYQIVLPAQAAGAHSITVRAADAAGNNGYLAIPFRSVASGTGSGNLLRRTASAQICQDCHNLQTHNSQNTSTTYGNWSVDCATCHTPHQTNNIFLIRPAIDTPNSGRKAVDFRATTGVAANSYATPQLSGNGVNVCEVCHTRTKNSDSTPRARNNSATDWTKHYTGDCIGCHGHGGGFAAGESSGGTTCSGCHSAIWNRMQATGGSAYRHTLAVNSFTDDTVTWGNPLATNLAGVRSCVNTCHNDHPHTAADDPSPTLHYNLAYGDAASNASRAATTRTVATKARTDFDNSLASGGLCVSCHKNPVESGTTPTHALISQANYNTSAHNTTSTTPGGAWQYTLHDGSNFVRNCTKCHWDSADGTTPAISGRTAIGAVHGNTNPSLLMGTTNPNGAPASQICYRCHGGGTTGADYSSKAVYQDGVKAYKHPMDADNVHNSSTEFYNAAWGNTLGVTGRHSNCQDCHHPHDAKKSIKQGTATASTTTTLTDSTMNGRWTASQWVGSILYIPTLASGQNTRNITASTAAGALTVAAWTAAPAVGTVYYILDNKADGGLAGAWGAQLTTNPTLWTAPGTTSFTKKTIVAGSDLQATLCFKCHSSYYWGAGTVPNGVSPNGTATTPVETDVAMEFNPNNKSGHPVLANLNGFTGSAAPKPLVAAQMVAPWNVNVGTQTMSCNDCHSTDAASPAAQGPHGSAVQFMLKGANATGWPNVTLTNFATSWCANCHAKGTWDPHATGNHSSVQCYKCHIVVPHGGKMSRLIGSNNSTMPARYAYNNTLTNMYIRKFTKHSPGGANYVESDCGSGTSGCTNHSGGTESW